MHFDVRILGPAQKYLLEKLTKSERVRAMGDINSMAEGDFDAVSTKPLKNKIRELRIGRHRVTYFQVDATLYFVRGFPKKSEKTPKNEIEYAEQIYRLMQ